MGEGRSLRPQYFQLFQCYPCMVYGCIVHDDNAVLVASIKRHQMPQQTLFYKVSKPTLQANLKSNIPFMDIVPIAETRVPLTSN